jgi:hypothetical protein
MAAGVLQDITLGFQPLWNAQRQMAGVVLCVHTLPTGAVNLEPLLAGLLEPWHVRAPALLLGTAAPHMLAALLDLAPGAVSGVVVNAELLSDPVIHQRVQLARQRGLRLIWRGQTGQTALPAVSATFHQNLVSLTAQDALLALRVSLRRLHGADHPASMHDTRPIQAGQLYDGVASRVLAEHCLDEQSASALLGWPMEDVLWGHRQTRIQPSHRVIQDLIKAIDAEASMDEVEQCLGHDPVLAYRFLRFINSAGLGLRQEIDALRQGLMVLGLTRTKSWLQDLLPLASHDLNLQPVRQMMVLRARFMAQLLDAGASEALHREMYLCGLLSQIDLLLGESMSSALRSIPVPTRVKEAVLSQTGPYWPYLAMAMSLETGQLEATRSCCTQHGFELHDVNLALMRTLASFQPG